MVSVLHEWKVWARSVRDITMQHAGCFNKNALVSNADHHTFIEMGDSLIDLGHRNNKIVRLFVMLSIHPMYIFNCCILYHIQSMGYNKLLHSFMNVKKQVLV
jgi:hypothetical protein